MMMYGMTSQTNMKNNCTSTKTYGTSCASFCTFQGFSSVAVLMGTMLMVSIFVLRGNAVASVRLLVAAVVIISAIVIRVLWAVCKTEYEKRLKKSNVGLV